MATEEEADTLKLYWDHFFKAETGTYEKSTWLDLFLAEFLIRLNNGANAKELIHFCPVSGVVTLVGCELLCGIHRVTSSINTHYSAPLVLAGLDASITTNSSDTSNGDNAEADRHRHRQREREADEETQSRSVFARANAQSSDEILRKYILGGVAWRCLLLLRALGVEGLSCCRQLSSVLIWLFGELSAAGSEAAPHPSVVKTPTLAPRTPIHQLFSNRIWAKQRPSPQSKSVIGSPEKYSRSRTSTSHHDTPDRKRRPAAAASAAASVADDTDQSSESADSNSDLQILNRSVAIQACAPDDQFQYFNSSKRSSNEYPDTYTDTFHSPRKPKPKPDDFINDKHREIINSEIAAFEFTLIITDLLRELCKAESSLSGSEGSQISMQCINFSLRNLCSTQFSSLSSSSQTDLRQVSTIKVALTELLIVALDKVLVHADLAAKLINSGVLPMLLRVLEDVIGKSKKDRLEQVDKTESENLLKFVFGIAYSITAFFHCLLMQCRSVDKLREFTDQFKLYGECLKGSSLRDCIELMIRIPGVDNDADEAVILIKKLIEILGKLINGMKRVRSEVIHSGACPRTRHKACRQRVAAGVHHHHDVLGEPAASALPLASTCCVSLLYATLTALLTDEKVSARSVLRNKILRVMLNCGVCCCFSPAVLMESIVRLMLTHDSVASLCLQVLEHTVYGELGASVLVPRMTDQLPCSVCELSDERKELARAQCQHAVGVGVQRKSVCSFLIHYNSLLQLDNHNNVLHATVTHLLRVTPKCRTEMKYELLFSVIYPTFIVAKHRYTIRLEESAFFLTVSCLNIFASLLNTVSFAEQFIQKGGLSYVLELVALPEFSNQCCSILEIAIIVEIFKLMKENSELTYYREMSSLSSVQMLFKSLSEVTDKCYKIYRLKLPSDKYEELVNVDKERAALSFIPSAEHVLVERQASASASMPRAVNTSYAASENTYEESMEDHIDVLKNIWTFWKTCAALCLYSPMFREYMAGEGALLDSYALLKLALHCLCARDADTGTGGRETRLLIKLMEALLTVQLAVADVTSGRSKETSCLLVREALVAPALAPALAPAPTATLESGTRLRALCEALIRVATAEPSRYHAMPRLAHAKVPPLLCPVAGIGSSASCSSSEESAAPVYASEHSEPAEGRRDEGYEADVEIGKFDILLPPHKSRKISANMSSISSSGISLDVPASLSECTEYTKHGELAHPELCTIVVDILSQLIDKVLQSRHKCEGNGGVGNMGVQRVGVQLARACCSRLATALAGACSPQRLVQRLLQAPLRELLTTTDPALEDLQRSILELIHVLASQSISAEELGALLRLLTAEAPPLTLLLTALQRLTQHAAQHTPDAILTFPAYTHHTDTMQSLSEEFVHLTMNGVSSQSHLAESSARKLYEAHTRDGIVSAWSAGAGRVGVEGAGWAPWMAGFALVLWLQAHAQPQHDTAPDNDEDPDGDSSDAETNPGSNPARKPASKPAGNSPGKEGRVELAHVLSIGHSSLMFEIWLEPQTGSLTLRLTRPEPSGVGLVSAARVVGALPPRKWACLALNVMERVSRRTIHIQVTIFVNGHELETISLPLQGILVRKVTPTLMIVGHTMGVGSIGSGAYHLSAAHVYRAPLLTGPRAMHVAAHGPDSECMVRCEFPNYPSLLTPNVLDSNIDWDQVYEMSRASLRELHDNLLLCFNAQAPHIANLYHQTAVQVQVLPTVFSGRGASVGGVSDEGGGGGGGGASIPEALFLTWTAAPLASRYRGLAAALYTLQGTDVLLYLYARVVELEGTAVEQAMALGILLRACRLDDRLYASFHSERVPDMLLTVFAAPKCHLTPHLLKVILESACSAALLRTSSSGVQVLARSDAVVLEPSLLVLLARAASRLDTTKEFQWEVEGCESLAGAGKLLESGSVWALALRCMCVLLRRRHPRRAFNHYQLSRAELLPHLLLACKERFLNSESGEMEASASESLVELVRGLMGSPPLLHRLALLADFLLLMHQASDTFVTHSRANFYFLLTSETQEMSEFTSAARRRTSKRIKRRADNNAQARPSVASLSDDMPVPTDDNVNAKAKTNANALKDMVQSREDSDKMESSLDSTKQMKGIINMQIKEGRKHNISSTSETSDTTAELAENSESEGRVAPPAPLPPAPPAADGGGGAAGGELNEYIVVDEEEVSHTTVEMYTSGIYTKGRVRAGAGSGAGWAACEGLLLVLRDAVRTLTGPHDHLTQAVCNAIQAESLVVLGNHRSVGVRAAVVRVLAALQRRQPPDLAKKRAHQHYYIHLANQISLYEGSWELATACAALITKCDVPLEDQLDEEMWMDVDEDAICRSPPLLALLPSCLREVPLAHNITRLASRILDKASLKLLNEVSLVEVVVRSIRAIGLMGDEEFEGRQLLLQDLYDLLNKVAVKALSTQHSMQTIVEIHHMLSYIEMSNGGGGGAGEEEMSVASVARLASDAQCSLYNAQLDYLEEQLHSARADHSKSVNYFTNVLTSAVYLGGGGAGTAAGGVGRGEAGARLIACVTRCVSFLTTRTEQDGASASLRDRLLHSLPQAAGGSGSGGEAGSGGRTRWWWGGNEWISPLQELVCWALARRGEGAGAAVLRALYRAPSHALHTLAPDPQHNRKLAVYVLMILKDIHAEAESGPAPVELAITDWARSWALAMQAGLPDRLHSEALPLEATAYLRADEERWAKAQARTRPVIGKVVFSKESTAGRVAESAMCVTRAAVEAQNAERKRFIEHLRRTHAQAAAAALAWERLIETHTHDKGVWHEPRSYPQSWQLDATEGPGRVRVRLRRAHLHIQPRFLKPKDRHKQEAVQHPSPLRSVVGGTWAVGVRGGLVTRLQLNETVAYMARATCVTVACDTPGELLLSDRSIHFIPDDAEEGQPPPTTTTSNKRKDLLFNPEVRSPAQSWPLESVLQVVTRRWCLQEVAVELFLSSGHAHLLAFADVTERTAFLKALAACHLPGKISADTLAEAMSQWRSGTITNWEYLMRLNGLAGRSYNDLMQYPVLPFVLADYSSRILDLHEPAVYRDLARPMAVQNKNRDQHYITTYNDLKAARREGCSPLLSSQPHHYASLYSNSGGVLHYLVRLPPFTELFLNYQDNNFDMPDRTFHSLATTWRLITNDSATDVKELIPELFYLPELFYNNEGLNLGVRQCGLGVDVVELPPWAADARLFTLIHRQALEAAAVSERLPHWIDLVFGYKQTGQPALDALNVFPACTYYGFDPTALEDEVDRTAAAAMVRTYGQAPRQLLRHPHPHQTTHLHHQADKEVCVWDGVVGARWGRYCGSPALPAPLAVSRRACAAATAVQPLPAPRAIAATTRNTVLIALHGDTASASASLTQGSQPTVGVVSWGHSDNIVRLKRRRDAAPDLLLHTPALDQITYVSCAPVSAGCPYPLFLGHASGRVLGVRVRVRAGVPRVRTRALLAHTSAVAGIDVCAPAALLATASVDGTIVLWDLNKLTYIRTLPNRDMSRVTHVAISETLCDVATVHEITRPPAGATPPATPTDDHAEGIDYEKDTEHKYKSLVRVHTCNATFVGSVKVVERVTSACYSNAPEGVSVNCVALALASGGVRLYSSWDLRVARYIPPVHTRASLLSITYNMDSSLLFGCYEGGSVVAWESAPAARPAPVRIHPAHALC